MNACEIKAHLIGCFQYFGAVCFWELMPFGLNLVVVAVLRDTLCRVIAALRGRLLYVYNIVCKVKRLVLTN